MSKKADKKVVGETIKLEDITPPEFWADRLAMFDRLWEEQQTKYASLAAPIKVTLPDGKVMDGEAWNTTPLDIARKISNSLPDKVFVAKVDGQLWDLTRPLEHDSSIELLDWEDPEAQNVFWHSSSHILGHALERTFNCKLSVGPALPDGGFFYEGATSRPVTDNDYKLIESAMGELVKAKSPYRRLVVSKEDALKLFSYSEFKSKILSTKVPEGSSCTLYKVGNMIDPCRGPHLPDSGRVKAYAVTKNSSSYFEGDANQAVLQRVYGIAFPQDKLLKQWKELQEEAAKRDHRVIGRQQELFNFHDVSPGSAFWLPHGARIYNGLIEFIRKQYRRRGFVEVLSPNIFNAKLWMVSGHWEHYKDAMFRTTCEHEEFGLKPMNCPGHCILFGLRPRSYKELPIRMAEFGVLHRNELSGALTGLTRVRRFQQDDAHIFCRMDQIEEEMIGALDFLNHVYGVFGFKFHLKLSTRPANALGTKAIWDTAEQKLASALNTYCGITTEMPDPSCPEKTFIYDGTPGAIKKYKTLEKKREKTEGAEFKPKPHPGWELNEGDGAFYGPKIDICVEDALKRKHQCATIQLDFNMPERFGLKYTLPQAEVPMADLSSPVSPEAATVLAVTEIQLLEQERIKREKKEGKEHNHSETCCAPDPARDLGIDRSLDPNQARPVMIHRAIFGSLERCIAILCEHFGGKWPFWLSPRQIVVIPVSKANEEYARSVRDQFHGEGFHCEIDDSNGTLDKKIRNSQLAQYNFILCCGEKEMAGNAVDIRTRDNKRHGQKTIPEMMSWLKELRDTNSNDF